MPKAKSSYYAVRVGREPGIYTTWEECGQQISKFPKARYKKFGSLQEARTFMQEGRNDGEVTSSYRIPPDVPVVKDSPKQEKDEITLSNKVNNSNTQISTTREKDQEPDKLKVWTDGSALGNGRFGARAGVGVFWGANDSRNISERLPGPKQTNQRAEITAAIRALETCTDNHLTLEIKTDSQYLVKAHKSWIENWVKNGWKTATKQDVGNKDLFQRLLELIKNREGKVEITYVPGHAGVEGNEAADRLANAGALLDDVVINDNYNSNIIPKEIINEEDDEIARTEEQFNRSLDSSIASIPSPSHIISTTIKTPSSISFDQVDNTYPISEEYIDLLVKNNCISDEQLDLLKNSK
ncbi:929_t:CDS:2 [Ambispora gerdemannii]|uniref:ribonuclease H n=1 Tax=Ambispora gerdemannii TaxID=144530 RepID=A0A9N8VMK5_9GLOM|nr:929_t:CDS:2 [Ambispora gerdemannii]